MESLITALPIHLREQLQKLHTDLLRQLGERLVSLLVFGSVARGEFRELTSDIDVVIVVQEANLEVLEILANPLQLARNAGRIEAMVLVASEIPHSADVFPLLYDDLRSCHLSLHGENPFLSLTITDQYRRLRIEQELREASIRLRRAVTDTNGSPRQLAGAIERKIKQLRSPFRALLMLHGQQVGVLLPEVLAATGAYYKIDLTPFERLRADPKSALLTLQKLLDVTIKDVDHLETLES